MTFIVGDDLHLIEFSGSTGSTDRFSAVPVPEYPRHRLGKDVRGQPCLLISVREAGRHGSPIVLENLSLQYDVGCRITKPSGETEVGAFAVLRCTNADELLEAHFLRVGGTLLASLGRDPTANEVRSATEQLVELFRAMDTPSSRTVQGFWAELLLIADSENPAELITSWHVLPTDQYDFTLGTHRLEVKAAEGSQREHHFSLDQLTPPSGTVLFVPSFLIQRAGGGSSVEDLLTRVRSRVSSSPELQLMIDRVSAQTLGSGWRDAYTQRFDLQRARQSLQFIDAVSIPCPSKLLPAGVRSVRFISDLSQVQAISRESLSESAGLVASALPR